ncbi:hypothetical protein QJS10_CPA08g01617 [Acorus calamus]|uniref:Uncharacterized protein n=1 Tax=Acorus calamus TaxID=4465 RepID=A0AAV9EBX4_ACOCL|nr:hypothetical protein QJS10_CPA08g01617 [Acorus calamus]
MEIAKSLVSPLVLSLLGEATCKKAQAIGLQCSDWADKQCFFLRKEARRVVLELAGLDVLSGLNKTTLYSGSSDETIRVWTSNNGFQTHIVGVTKGSVKHVENVVEHIKHPVWLNLRVSDATGADYHDTPICPTPLLVIPSNKTCGDASNSQR